MIIAYGKHISYFIRHNLAAEPTDVISLYSSLESLAMNSLGIKDRIAYDVRKSA